MKLSEHGIEITRNDFCSSGVCKYKDSYDNSVFARRTDDGFVVKLRFADKEVKAEPIYVSVPIKEDEEGTTLHLDYPGHKNLETEDIQKAIYMLTVITQHWINMLLDIRCLGIDNQAVAESNNMTIEDVAKIKVTSLYEYEELTDLVNSVMQ